MTEPGSGEIVTIEDSRQNVFKKGVVAGERLPRNLPRHTVEVRWNLEMPALIQVEIKILSEDESGFSSYVPRLPGVRSQGESVDEVVGRTKEALIQALSAYFSGGETVPWLDLNREFEGGESRWISVDVRPAARG